MLDVYPVRGQPAELVFSVVRLLGTGAADPTKQRGDGITATYVSTGKYRLTFAEHLGTFEGAWGQFGQAAPAAGATNIISIDHDSYSASTRTLDFFVEDPGTEAAAPALADLASTDKVFLLIAFSRTS